MPVDIIVDSHRERHEAWSADDWDRVVFSDECTFTNKWDQRSGVQTELVVASGRTVGSVWGCITRDGLGPLVRIQGALTADKYSNILDTVGLPHITSHITLQHDCIFQHDRSPVHTAKKVARLLQQRGVTVLILHEKSADDLWAAVNEKWERLKCDSNFTEALYRSLPERMKAVVDAEGDVTRY
ncbi:hypothetical protein HPB49_008720 [Dermacentor silvarum]|uniref:Uncharacterized protein n=1 Tax=Dermacentor silvarum TaxID=543639 RepID=A0ACB8CWC4_DERSI|nr:hypothetical protein HPB49_008720 [Dermacentor silvarum]